MINQELEHNLNIAFKIAQEQKHEFVTVEHLLLALLDNSDAKDLFNSNKVSVEQLKVDLEEFVGSTTPKISNDSEIDIQPTLGFQRVIQRAVFHVQSSGKDEVRGSNVLVAIFSEKESQSVFLLEQAGLTRLDAVSYLSQKNLHTPYDLAFVDPPFDGTLYKEACAMLEENQWLTESAMIYCEISSNSVDFSPPTNWKLEKDKTTGDVRYILYSRFETSS